MPPRLCGRGRNTGLTPPPPPFHAFGEAVSQLRASGAAGTLLVRCYALWWHLLGPAPPSCDVARLGFVSPVWPGLPEALRLRTRRPTRTQALRGSSWRRPGAGRSFACARPHRPHAGQALHSTFRGWRQAAGRLASLAGLLPISRSASRRCTPGLRSAAGPQCEHLNLPPIPVPPSGGEGPSARGCCRRAPTLSWGRRATDGSHSYLRGCSLALFHGGAGREVVSRCSTTAASSQAY